ncbi:MAG: MtaA/CmuA family methyltransferase [bacterium]|nr:MtaA/CmuA family methyltransferase [bacterium]
MHVLNQQKPDRMPCFGANSTVTYDQMEKVQAFRPDAHFNGEAMAKQALAAYSVPGFDAVRVPFCQTFEAEALGCELKHGGSEGIPGIEPRPPYTIDDTPEFPDDFPARGRIPELLKATLKAPAKIPAFIEVGEKAGTMLGQALIEAGADMISCEDMSSSPALLTPQTYQEVVLGYQQRQFAALSVPKILHICGRVDPIVEWMGQTGADDLSLEPKAGVQTAREKCGANVVLMGGADTATTLYFKSPADIKAECETMIADGI